LLSLFAQVRFILLLSLILLPVPGIEAVGHEDTSRQQSLNHTSPLQVRYYQRTLDAQLSDYESYWIGLLKLALKKSGSSYQLTPVGIKGIPHARLVSNLLNNGPVNIIFMGTTKEMEDILLPIRIPLFRGLVGYRIMMTSTEYADVFADISSVAEFKKVVIGLGLNWADEAIMKEAGLNVVTLPYHRLFNALAGGRFHGVSRGAHEIRGEYEILKHSKTNLLIDKHLVLAYRLATFFFVAPDNLALANALTAGLEQAYEDGSFLLYFNQHPAVTNAIALLNDPKRTWLWLDNHHVSKQTLNIPASYWFSPK